MEYEKVIDKVKKLQALVDRGERGEVLAAKRALDEIYVLNIISTLILFLTKKRNGFLLNYLIMIN